MTVVEDKEGKTCPRYYQSTGHTIPKRLEEYLCNINAGMELAALYLRSMQCFWDSARILRRLGGGLLRPDDGTEIFGIDIPAV